MKKNKPPKEKKLKFYERPFKALLEKSTNLTLSYLYEFSKASYNEERFYDDWLIAVKEFMSKEVKV